MPPRRERFVSTKQFLESARDYDITTEECILETLDNSFDANASKVRIDIEKQKDMIRIMVTDNGIGIPRTHTDDSGIIHQGIPYILAYGGRIPHPGKTSMIGKFGWGLSQAASSLSVRTEIFTKTPEDEEWRFGYYDFKELAESDRCELEPEVNKHPPSVSLPESGTIIIFYMDKSEYKSVNGVKTMIDKNLGRIYRKYIQNGSEITISYLQGNKIVSDIIDIKDPLHQIPGSKQVSMFGSSSGPYDSTLVLDGNSSVGKFIDPNTGQYAEIRIRMCLIDRNAIASKLGITSYADKGSIRKMGEWGISANNQGFSIIRNGREIRFGETLGLWTKGDWKYTYIKGELEFPEILDDLFNVQVNKSRFKINHSLKNMIENKCSGTLRSLVKEHQNNVTASNLRKKKKEVSSAERVVNLIAHRIPKVKVTAKEKEMGQKRKEEKIEAIIAKAENESDQLIITAKESLSDAKRNGDKKQIEIAEEVLSTYMAEKIETVKQIRNRFAFESPIRKEFGVLGSGNMYEVEHLGEEVWITMNTDTPFFKIVYEKALMKPEEESLLDLMIFAMAWAEHMKKDEPEIKKFWEEARPVVSNNAHLFCSKMKLEDDER
jgi:hypothetical protein